MRKFAAVMCQDVQALEALKAALKELGMERVICQSRNQAMEMALCGNCSALIVDFDLPGAPDVAKMVKFLKPPQKPVLLALSGVWPETGPAFQSGAQRILYKPLTATQVKQAIESVPGAKGKNRRRSPRHEMQTVVHLEFPTGAVPALGIDISEHGIAVRATEPIAARSDVPFHCALPGTGNTLHGRVDLIWTDEQGRAGAFFSHLAPSARKLLKHWLSRHGGVHREDAARILVAQV